MSRPSRRRIARARLVDYVLLYSTGGAKGHRWLPSIVKRSYKLARTMETDKARLSLVVIGHADSGECMISFLIVVVWLFCFAESGTPLRATTLTVV